MGILDRHYSDRELERMGYTLRTWREHVAKLKETTPDWQKGEDTGIIEVSGFASLYEPRVIDTVGLAVIPEKVEPSVLEIVVPPPEAVAVIPEIMKTPVKEVVTPVVDKPRKVKIFRKSKYKNQAERNEYMKNYMRNKRAKLDQK
jgi:hypothetical protein